MHWPFSILLSVTVVLTLPSCSWFDPEPTPAIPEKDETPTREIVGRIASIDKVHGFVLIRGFHRWNLAAGTILTSSSADGRSANLLVSGEAQGNFAAADVQSGMVEIGDAVYRSKMINASTQGNSPSE